MKVTLTRVMAAVALAAMLGAAGVWAVATRADDPAPAGGVAPAKPALSVRATKLEPAQWPRLLVAHGNIAAWQEAVIGAELSGHRLTEVRVSVGDTVKKGQLLARIADDTVAAELAEAKAAQAEAEAMLVEARTNAERARRLADSGFYSRQQVTQFATAEQTAAARLAAARARVQASAVRLGQTRVLAPDDGVISARTATVGSLTQGGQELFRLIRGGRLEWRAEVTAAELARLRPGIKARVVPPGAENGEPIEGTVRALAPTVDPQTRNALVYVELPPGSGARAGMFAPGEFLLGPGSALTLPQSAVLLREGFSYVFRIEPDGKVTQVKVAVGRRSADRVEITGGLEPGARVVESGGAFLADGDTVRVIELQAQK